MISTIAEKKLERDVIKAFKEAGWYARHVDPSPGEAGFPDVLAEKDNFVFNIELKTKTELRPEQKIFIRRNIKRIGRIPVIHQYNKRLYRVSFFTCSTKEQDPVDFLNLRDAIYFILLFRNSK